MSKWAELFARLRTAQRILDPAMADRGGPIECDPEARSLPSELRSLYEAAGDDLALDRDWVLTPPTPTDDAAGEWPAPCVLFATDSGEHRLGIALDDRRIMDCSLDPPDQRELARDLEAWMIGLVERLEAEVLKLPPNHAANLRLLDAVKRAALADVERALADGADANAHLDEFTSAISLAAETAALPVLRRLLEHGADLARPALRPPLHAAITAAADGDEGRAVVAFLLDHGASIEQRETYYGRPPLVRAAARGLRSIVELLLARGADVNARTVLGSGPNADGDVGVTALLVALLGKDETGELALMLLEHGADPNARRARTDEGPLFPAARHYGRNVVERLLDAGADPNHPNRRGERPLDAAIRRCVDPQNVELLRERTARRQ